MDKKRISEFKRIDSYSIFEFPFSGFKAVGGIQLGLGILCVVLGIVNVVTFVLVTESPTFTDDNLKLKHTLATRLALSSTSIWSGIWFCMSGVMALNISKNNMAGLYCFKLSFLVLSLLCAVLFGPTSLGVNAYEAMLRHDLYANDYKWMVPLTTAFCALNEIVFAVISAVVCCCCASLKENKVKIFYGREDNDIQENSTFEVRPRNPHLQTVNSKEPRELWQGNRSKQVEPSIFKPSQANKDSHRSNFTAEHLKKAIAW